MKKKNIIILFISFIILASATIFYLNKVVLPIKIKSLIIKGIQEATGKKVNLDSVQFNIFKGLVIKNLVISDGAKAIISLKEGSCAFIIPAIFNKKIILNNIRLQSPQIILERKADNTFNLMDLLPRKETKEEKAKFSVFIRKISMTDGRIDFQDNTNSPLFTKSIDNLNAEIFLFLPTSVKFDFKGEISGKQRMEMAADGEFNLVTTQIACKITLRNFSPQEFSVYYKDLGFSIPEGTISTHSDIIFKDDVLSLHSQAEVKKLIFSSGQFQSKLNSDVSADIKYNLKDKKLIFSGTATLADSNLSGVAFIGRVDNISGDVKFNNAGLSADKINASISGMPLGAKVSFSDFNNPLLNISISSLDLNALWKVLKDKFKLESPIEIRGAGELALTVAGSQQQQLSQINGSLDVSKGRLSLSKTGLSLEDIVGKFEFTQEQLKWSGMNFKYQGAPYQTDGNLTNFQTPLINFALSSRDLSLESNLTVNNKLIKLSKLKGKYIDSEFTLSGSLDVAKPAMLMADITGELNLDLKDIKEPFKKFQKQIEKINPSGIVHVNFVLNGNINDFKSCMAQADFSSPFISAYGLKSQSFSLHYVQENGLIEMPLIHLSLYDGSIDGNVAMNISAEHLPYRVDLGMNNIEIEKLKLDTAAKDKDIAGIIQAQIKLSGYSNDLSKLTGAGRILVTEGKLWELNLFKGLGKLIFAKEFSNIVFSEASCGFIIQNQSIFTDNLKLKSKLVELTGTSNIAFDGTLDAAIDLHVLNKMIPLNETFKDVIVAIAGKLDTVGVIKISGTLKEPTYKFQPAVIDILKGLKDTVLDGILKR
jgi:hypothetical protein